MAAIVTTITYDTKADLTFTTANSLATSSTLLAGASCLEVSNASNMYVDVLVQGLFTTNNGANSTVGGTYNVYVYGSDVPAATTNLDTLLGTDATVTISNDGLKYGLLKLGASVTLTAVTQNLDYPIGAFSIAQLFGGVMPKYWGLWVTHNLGQTTKSTGNSFTMTGIKYTTT